MLSSGTSSRPSSSSCTSAARRPSISRSSQHAMNWKGCFASPSLPLKRVPRTLQVECPRAFDEIQFLHAAIRKIDRFAQKSVDVCGRSFALSSAFANRLPVQIIAGEKETRYGGDRASYPCHAIAVAEPVLGKCAPMSRDGQRAGPPASPEGLGKLVADECHEVVVGNGGGLRVAHAT